MWWWRSQSQLGSSAQRQTRRVQIIYFYHDPAMPLYLLMIYAKARRDDLSPDARRTVQGLWRA
jgi:hypothetical protein